MLKIIIADDHEIVRQGLKQILLDAPDMNVAGEASNGQELLDRIAKERFDIALLDISFPGKNGLVVLQEIKRHYSRLPVLILSMHPEDQLALRALRAGASGYLTKDSPTDDLIAAIRKVASGGKYVSASLAEKLAYHFDGNNDKPLHEKLSNREYEIMCLIASGKRVKDISDQLALSVKTVSTVRSRILEKMNLKNNAEITYYAIKRGLVG